MRRLALMCAALGATLAMGLSEAQARDWGPSHHRHYGWERGHHYGWRDRHRAPVYGMYRHHPRQSWHHRGYWR
jgi:hypothetical protein